MEGTKIYERSYKELVKLQKNLSNNEIVINFKNLDTNSSGSIRSVLSNFSSKCNECGFDNSDCIIKKIKNTLSFDEVKIKFSEMEDFCSGILKNKLMNVFRDRAKSVYSTITNNSN